MEHIVSQMAPDAVGPYCHAVIHNKVAYLSGQIPLDPDTMEIKGQTIESQTEQVLKNIRTVLSTLGLGLDAVIKTTVFLNTMDDFVPMNEVYEKNFGSHKPARSTIAVAGLPKGALVEIECLAAIK